MKKNISGEIFKEIESIGLITTGIFKGNIQLNSNQWNFIKNKFGGKNGKL
jgi:hypothetical protein